MTRAPVKTGVCAVCGLPTTVRHGDHEAVDEWDEALRYWSVVIQDVLGAPDA